MKTEQIESMNDALSILPFKVPSNILGKIFNDSKKIQKEVASGGINDTEEREYLLQKVLKELNLPNYPAHGMEDKTWPAFLDKLRKVATKFSIDMQLVEVEEQKRLDSLKPIHKIKLIDDSEKTNFEFKDIVI